jgi:parvulin-like peptidyl-prolyl isomerase
VIKVYSKSPAGTVSFEEMKPKLVAEQREQAQRDAFEGLIAGLRKQAAVRVLYKPEGPPGSPGAQAPGPAPAAPKAPATGR